MDGMKSVLLHTGRSKMNERTGIKDYGNGMVILVLLLLWSVLSVPFRVNPCSHRHGSS